MPFSHTTEYEDEAELEEVFFEEYKSIFGENSFLLDKKILIKTGFDEAGSIPDGIIIDFESGKWFVVEVELIKHGVWAHIAPQIVKILVALQNSGMKKIYSSKIVESLSENRDALNLIKENIGFEDIALHGIIDKILESSPIICIPIDSKKNEDLVDLCRCFKYEAYILEIEKIKDERGEIHYKPDEQIMNITPTKGEVIVPTKTVRKGNTRKNLLLNLIFDLGGIATRDQINAKIPDYWELSPEELQIEEGVGKPLFWHHSASLCQALKDKDGFLENPSRGEWKINDAGKIHLDSLKES